MEKNVRSWFRSLLDVGKGEIKYSNNIIEVETKKNPELNKLIDQAYFKKYTQPVDIKYAKGITKQEYSKYTVELFYKKKQNFI